MVQRLPESHLTLYAELVDQMIPAAAARAVRGVLAGSFTTKRVKGHTYWYLQRSEGARTRQIYLGPDSPALRRWIDEAAAVREVAETEAEPIVRLSRMLASGGATTEPAAVLKVLRVLAESRVFHLGGVVVGTVAFRSYANLLGVRFGRGASRSQDVDVAHDPAIGIALARGGSPVRLEEILVASGLDLHPVPPLDPKQPSTSFKVRGRDLRVDFLTPMRGRESSEPVYLPAFRLSATPLPWLDYLIADPQQAPVLGTDPVLVNVPLPGRFAVHKLWTSRTRPATVQVKARKDFLQAGEVLEVLVEDRPDDLREAWEALPDARLRGTARDALGSLPDGLAAKIRTIVGE
jgi:hypothetical protein